MGVPLGMPVFKEGLLCYPSFLWILLVSLMHERHIVPRLILLSNALELLSKPNEHTPTANQWHLALHPLVCIIQVKYRTLQLRTFAVVMLHRVHGCHTTCSILSPPFGPPLHLQRTCLLWCVGYDLQHGIMPGPCSYSCVTGKMSVSLQHPGLHMDEFPALDARPQCIFCDAMFHFTCWKTVEATDILSDQHFIRHSPMPFSPGPSSSFSPSCPSLSTPPLQLILVPN